MEVSSHAIALHRIDGCELDVGVFTNLSQDHLDFHHDMISYWDIKKRLFTEILVTGSKKRAAKAVINRDDPRGEKLAEELSLPVIGIGKGKSNQIYPRGTAIRPEGIFGMMIFGDALKDQSTFEFKFHSPLTGAFNLENILCAAGACRAIGVRPKAIGMGIARTGAVPGRLERVENKAGIYVYVDYAHTPAALENVLKALRDLARNRVICVFGCGGNRDREKRPQMGKIAVEHSDLAVITSDNPRNEPPEDIIAQIASGIEASHTRRYTVSDLERGWIAKGFVMEVDRRTAIQLAITVSQPGDTILIAGKGHETYQILGKRTIAFDDREEARQAVQIMLAAQSVRTNE
jgi:UDP-N-acetylmuramyl-tripeptide synthetase